jgi:mannose-6-phosphate isomerase
MIEHALPLWATQGWDERRGGFVERLAPDGTADSEAPRRLRVQARQIYCFARAAQIGWYPPGRDLALRGLEHMLTTSKSPDGRPGFVSLLAPDGAVLSAARDTYDHAFVLLALAHAFQFDCDAQIRAEIDSAVAFLDDHLKSEHGGYIEGIPASVPRRQNPHMHLFEAMIALFDATRDIGFQSRAGELYSLFLAHFFDKRTGLLSEYFEDDWSRILPLSIEPGHQAEWVWLLKNFQRITDCPTDKPRSALLASALRYSDARTGCLVDEGDIDGHIVKPSGRCWPQTELARAWMAQAESGIPGASDAALDALVRVERYYLRHPVRGGWYDQFDHHEVARAAFIPATSFYHVLGAITEAERVLGT